VAAAVIGCIGGLPVRAHQGAAVALKLDDVANAVGCTLPGIWAPACGFFALPTTASATSTLPECALNLSTALLSTVHAP
jgi:hypothetical protein